MARRQLGLAPAVSTDTATKGLVDALALRLGTPAAFPSRLTTSGRSLIDENGYVMPTLKGFNVQCDNGFTWAASHFTDMAALGARINRVVVFWDTFEPTQGTISTGYRDALDLHIARAEAAGMYTIISIHLNVGRTPAWSATNAETTPSYAEVERYYLWGQNMTTYLAGRYGNPTGAKYTKSVIGIGLNEPGIADSAVRNGTGALAFLEVRQRQMITWARTTAGASNWIGFITTTYANATPTYDTYTTSANTTAVPASTTAYNAVGGNVVFDFHDYNAGMTSAVANDDGRQYNGIVLRGPSGGVQSDEGGTFILVESTAHSYTSTALARSQMAAYLDPYKRFTIAANIPLMLGEWGFPSGDTIPSEEAFIADKIPIWDALGTVIQLHWDYDVNATNDKWAARPAGYAWRTSVSTWMGQTWARDATRRNGSIIDQTGFAADAYLVGSRIDLPVWLPVADTRYTLKFAVTKTGAGTAAPTLNIRLGTAGTTADTSRLLFTWGAGTGVADTGILEVEVLFRTVGASTLAVMTGAARFNTNLTTTGLSNAVKALQVTSSGFDSTVANSVIGASWNGGTSASHTIKFVSARLEP